MNTRINVLCIMNMLAIIVSLICGDPTHPGNYGIASDEAIDLELNSFRFSESVDMNEYQRFHTVHDDNLDKSLSIIETVSELQKRLEVYEKDVKLSLAYGYIKSTLFQEEIPKIVKSIHDIIQNSKNVDFKGPNDINTSLNELKFKLSKEKDQYKTYVSEERSFCSFDIKKVSDSLHDNQSLQQNVITLSHNIRINKTLKEKQVEEIVYQIKEYDRIMKQNKELRHNEYNAYVNKKKLKLSVKTALETMIDLICTLGNFKKDLICKLTQTDQDNSLLVKSANAGKDSAVIETKQNTFYNFTHALGIHTRQNSLFIINEVLANTSVNKRNMEVLKFGYTVYKDYNANDTTTIRSVQLLPLLEENIQNLIRSQNEEELLWTQSVKLFQEKNIEISKKITNEQIKQASIEASLDNIEYEIAKLAGKRIALSRREVELSYELAQVHKDCRTNEMIFSSGMHELEYEYEFIWKLESLYRSVVTKLFPKCINQCTDVNNGTCVFESNTSIKARCLCNWKYYGSICELTRCSGYQKDKSILTNINLYQHTDDGACSGNGICDSGKGKCVSCNMNSYHGERFACELLHCLGGDNCSDNGTCDKHTGKCTCNEGHYHLNCQYKRCIVENCRNRGKCNQSTGMCSCTSEYYGDNCEYRYCLNKCNGRGKCETDGRCICMEPYIGNSCEFIRCPFNCSNNGECDSERGVCLCKYGWEGKYCNRVSYHRVSSAITSTWLGNRIVPSNNDDRNSKFISYSNISTSIWSYSKGIILSLFRTLLLSQSIYFNKLQICNNNDFSNITFTSWISEDGRGMHSGKSSSNLSGSLTTSCHIGATDESKRHSIQSIGFAMMSPTLSHKNYQIHLNILNYNNDEFYKYDWRTLCAQFDLSYFENATMVSMKQIKKYKKIPITIDTPIQLWNFMVTVEPPTKRSIAMAVFSGGLTSNILCHYNDYITFYFKCNDQKVDTHNNNIGDYISSNFSRSASHYFHISYTQLFDIPLTVHESFDINLYFMNTNKENSWKLASSSLQVMVIPGVSLFRQQSFVNIHNTPLQNLLTLVNSSLENSIDSETNTDDTAKGEDAYGQKGEDGNSQFRRRTGFFTNLDILDIQIQSRSTLIINFGGQLLLNCQFSICKNAYAWVIPYINDEEVGGYKGYGGSYYANSASVAGGVTHSNITLTKELDSGNYSVKLLISIYGDQWILKNSYLQIAVVEHYSHVKEDQ